MPIYEYKCSECQHTLELLQKVTAPPPAACPQCGRPTLVKQVTAAGFQLKGSGWYVTDFRDGGAAKKDARTEAAKTNGEAPAPAASSEGAGKQAAATDSGASASPAPAPAPAPAAPAPSPGSGSGGTSG